jgi:hypothetical protein
VEEDWTDFVSSLKGLPDALAKSKLKSKAGEYPHSSIMWLSNKGELMISIGKTKESNTKWDIDKTIEFMTKQERDTYFTTQSYLDGAEHKTVIISSHLLHEIDLMADELIFMNNGKIIFQTANIGERMMLYKLGTPYKLDESLIVKLQGQVIDQTDYRIDFVSLLAQKEVEKILEEHNITITFLEMLVWLLFLSQPYY